MDEEAIKQNDEDENEEVDEDDNEEVDEDDNEDVDEDDNKDDDDDASSELGAYCDEIKNCTNCPLHKTRNRFVFGMGNPNAELVFIGEAPGRDEDKQGLPFVGRAGKLFDKILAAMELTRDDVYICNILKCRPPGNRDPLPNEVTQCIPYLERQIEIIKPKLICALGRVAAQNLLDTKDPLSKLRGDIHFFRDTPVVTTYHPAALLRNPHFKGPAWRDFKWIVKILKDEELLRKYKPQKAQKLELDF
ncbi:uracil-DNA glycosylase [bacterium]|nr:uracil-DNA glycosylase [bacterium]